LLTLSDLAVHMSDSIIKVKGLGKKYIISHEASESYTTLRDVISRKVKNLLKKKTTNLAFKEEFWALKDVGFEIKKGEAVGIIGRNGAGKSTLLKILSRITEPTDGHIEINGRVASLLEVGTGFHPELTGRENIFLNGAILGMTRAEIIRKFDEIVDFSGIDKFLDTSVKRYSSGMYVRLAFAVAAYLEPEVLVVDEVLAVGDAEFQKKCIGKMDDVSKKEGRTVLFVSHNMAAISKLCSTSIMLEKGKLAIHAGTNEVIDYYLKEQEDFSANELYSDIVRHEDDTFFIHELSINNQSKGICRITEENNWIQVTSVIENKRKQIVALEARITDSLKNPFASFSKDQFEGSVQYYDKGIHTITQTIRLPEGMMKGVYYLDLYFTHPGVHIYATVLDGIKFEHMGFHTKTGNVLEYSSGYGWLLLK
jgi:lipopolysaccharide transport system ATP-binding protein